MISTSVGNIKWFEQDLQLFYLSVKRVPLFFKKYRKISQGLRAEKNIGLQAFKDMQDFHATVSKTKQRIVQYSCA